nr:MULTISPECIES: DUF3265 domain-containing protein [unclassified Vibrio]
MIRNTRHLYYALRLVFKVVCGGIGIAWLTRLIRRQVYLEET